MAEDLVQIVDAAVADAYGRGGAHLVCRPGCMQCCVGVFSISHQDAARLRDGLALLSRLDPERAAELRVRVAESLARVLLEYPGDPSTGLLTEEQASSDAFEEFANDEPCPVLDPQTGMCDLYAYRPILCRTFGPPARTAEGDLAHCELCFEGASQEEVAACELDPGLPTVVDASNQIYDAGHGVSGETTIAFALREC